MKKIIEIELLDPNSMTGEINTCPVRLPKHAKVLTVRRRDHRNGPPLGDPVPVVVALVDDSLPNENRWIVTACTDRELAIVFQDSPMRYINTVDMPAGAFHFFEIVNPRDCLSLRSDIVNLGWRS